MIHLELNDLLKKVDCRYTLVVETSKRARQLIDGAQPLTKEMDTNHLSQAVAEVMQDKVTYIRVTDGIK